MNKTTAVYLAGSASKLAKLLGINRAAVTQWSDDIPKKRVAQLKQIRPEWFDTLIVKPDSQM